MDLHELTTAQRKLAQQQLKDIQKGGKKKVQNASDKYSDKYFNANTTNKAMAAGRAKDKSLAAAADERVKSARNDARKAQADKLRKKKAERQGDLKRADSTLGCIRTRLRLVWLVHLIGGRSGRVHLSLSPFWMDSISRLYHIFL